MGIVQSFKDKRYKTCLLVNSFSSVVCSFNHMSTCRSSARNCYNSKKAKIRFKSNTLRLKNDAIVMQYYLFPHIILVTRHNFCYNVVFL
jgi:hypothetical protein